MLDELVVAYIGYYADVNMEQLIFMGDIRELGIADQPLTDVDMGKLKSLWDHFVRPRQEGTAS